MQIPVNNCAPLRKTERRAFTDSVIVLPFVEMV
jgi:hypothetical protein